MDGPEFNKHLSINAINKFQQLKISRKSIFPTYSKSIPPYTTLNCPEPRISSEDT